MVNSIARGQQGDYISRSVVSAGNVKEENAWCTGVVM